MKVKRYEARTMQEAIMAVKAELGREAIILHSKKIKKGGIFGLFGKPAFEVIAAISPEDQKPVKPASQQLQAIRELAPASQVPNPVSSNSGGLELESLHRELAGMKEALSTLSSSLKSRPEHSRLVSIPEEFRDIYTLLLEQEVAEEYIEEIISQVSEAGLEGEELRERVCQAAASFLRCGISADSGKRVLALIGPTGVGKTTTIAKLAAQFSLFEGLDVGLITADTYRIAAVDQLKTYAEIIGVPLEVVFSVEEIGKARAKLDSKDVILVDTAGRSQKNLEQVGELQGYLEAVQPTEIALVLSATTQKNGLEDCLKRFKPCAYNQVIFTKLDEADSYGPMYSVLRDADLPLTYITTGQNVPDDIRRGDPDYVARLLLGSQGEERNEP